MAIFKVWALALVWKWQHFRLGPICALTTLTRSQQNDACILLHTFLSKKHKKEYKIWNLIVPPYGTKRPKVKCILELGFLCSRDTVQRPNSWTSLGQKVLRNFLLAIHSHLYLRILPHPLPPTPRAKVVWNWFVMYVNIVYVNLKSENSQDCD